MTPALSSGGLATLGGYGAPDLASVLSWGQHGFGGFLSNVFHPEGSQAYSNLSSALQQGQIPNMGDLATYFLHSQLQQGLVGGLGDARRPITNLYDNASGNRQPQAPNNYYPAYS